MQLIDLSYPISDKMKSFTAPWHPEISVEQIGFIDNVGRNSRKITIGTHSGTHTDAPLHFVDKGTSIDEIPISRYVGPVTIVDLSYLNGITAVEITHLKNINITERMIFYFGQSEYWGEDKYYKEYPYFADETAQYLIDNGLKLIGLDTCSPDDPRIKFGTPEDSKIHKLFLENDVLILEYLNNLNTIDDLFGWNLSATPLKIKGGDGAPVRAYLFKQ